VPTDDFQSNLDLIIQRSLAQGAQVLLVPEFTSTSKAAPLLPYQRIMSALAEREGVQFYATREALSLHSEPDLLLDHNHMSKQGHQLLAELLLPTLLEGLELRHD
jgi:lysophospholipase L1-like esterase